MTTLSQISGYGLENATTGQKMDCAKEQLSSDAKFAAAELAAAGVGTAGVLASLNSDTFSKGIAGGVDKLANTSVGKDIKSAAGKLFETAKKNPTTAKAVAAISAVALLVTSAIRVQDIHKNGEIQGKHQERANHVNGNK